MADPKPARPVQLNEGHVPLQKGWKPAVQGGYVPTTSQAAPTPPTGGSAVKPVKPASA